MRRLLLVLLSLTPARDAYAQGPIEVSNPMAAHTLFIIGITVAFLGWAASFSIQIMKEKTQQKEHQELKRRREIILDRIAALEIALESGTISKERHKRQMKELRGELSRAIHKLQSASREKRHA